MTRYFTYRYGGRHQFLGPVSGLSYIFEKGAATPVDREDDAEIFLKMGSPESGVYLFREVDANANPIGPFPPVNPENRTSLINPRRFPSDQIGVSVKEWREATEDFADPVLFFHKSRVKLNFGRNTDYTV